MAHGGALQRLGLQRIERALAHQPSGGSCLGRKQLVPAPWGNQGSVSHSRLWILKATVKLTIPPPPPRQRPTEQIKSSFGPSERRNQRRGLGALSWGLTASVSRRFLPCFNKSFAFCKGKGNRSSCCLHHSLHRLGPATGLLAPEGKIVREAAHGTPEAADTAASPP